MREPTQMDYTAGLPTSAFPPHVVVDGSTADFFRVLSSPIRLAVLRLLGEGECCVSELVERLGIAQPRLSNHLACLRTCGFVTVQRHGTFIYYTLADARLADVLRLAAVLSQSSADASSTCPVLREERAPASPAINR
jgi:ArsR family transcriptional regulator, cadmium/lead-responsive transcriptional repressor